MITLYDMPLALNCYKVRLLLSLLGVKSGASPSICSRGSTRRRNSWPSIHSASSPC